jgi:hypothetical protein
MADRTFRMAPNKSIDQGRALLEDLRKHYLEKKQPTARLFWDSPLTAEDVEAVERRPRLSWLLAWKGEIFDQEGGEDSVIPKPLLLAVTWGQNKRLVTRLSEVLERQASGLKRLLAQERKSDPDFYKWVKSTKITARLLR